MKKLSCLCLILLMLVSQLCLFIYYPTYKALGSTPSAWSTTVQLMLSSDGTWLNWTPSSAVAHYTLLDENEVTNDSANYIYTSSSTYVNDSWNFADLTIPSFPTDYHVNVTAAFYAKKTGTTCNFYGFALIGGTEYSAALTLTTSYTWLYKTWTADPATGLNWTAAAINAMQIGVRGKLTVATYEYVAAAYVNVTYGWTPESETANQQFLWCDGFNSTTTAQTMVGASPYESSVDWNTNYFNTSSTSGTVSWFSFDNTTFSFVTGVYFEFRAYLNAIGYANFTFSDGENTTIYKYTITSDNNVWKWYSINITDWIGGSSAKVNATIVKFLLTQYALNDTYDCFRLNVTTPPLPTINSIACDTDYGGVNATFTVNASDTTELDFYMLATNASSSWVNGTWLAFLEDQTNAVNVSYAITAATVNFTEGYRFYVNNTYGSQVASSIQTFWITEVVLYPIGNGYSTELQPASNNYLLVDDPWDATDEDTTRVYPSNTTTNYYTDYYEMGNLTINTNSNIAIDSFVRLRTQNNAYRSWWLFMYKLNGQITNITGEFYNPATTYSYFNDTFSEILNETEINSLQLGVQARCGTDYAYNYTGYMTQIYIIVHPAIPIFKNGWVNTTKAGMTAWFYMTVYHSNIGETLIFSTNKTGTWTNTTVLTTTQSVYRADFNYSITLNSTVGVIVLWKWFYNTTAYGMFLYEQDQTTSIVFMLRTQKPTLIERMTDLIAAINYDTDFDTAYFGALVSKTNKTTLQNLIAAETSWVNVIRYSAFTEKYGIENETKIKWALNEANVTYYLPVTAPDLFEIHSRSVLYGFYYAAKFDYLTAKWNWTECYNTLHSAVSNISSGSFLWYDMVAKAAYSYSDRYYDENAETLSAFLILYEKCNVTAALDDALTIWERLNNYYWYEPEQHYVYNAAQWNHPYSYECSSGAFLSIIGELLYLNSTLSNSSRIVTDLLNRYVADRWNTTQWHYYLEDEAYFGVMHHYNTNPQRRMDATIHAWTVMLGLYRVLNETEQTNIVDMLTGYDNYPPAWELMFNPRLNLYVPTTNTFNIYSDTEMNLTWRMVDLLFFLSMVPNATLAVPLEELDYMYQYAMSDSGLFGLNIAARTMNVSILTSGDISFQWNQTVTQTFPSYGTYMLTFSSDWNTIESCVKIADLPTNRKFIGFAFPMQKSYAFTDTVISTVSFFWNKGLQFITTATTHSTDTLMFYKALGYTFLDASKSVASIVYNKALQFIATMTTQLADTSTLFKELGFAFLNTGKNTATMTYNLAAIFLNLEYTFTHPVLPQAFLTVQKELQFNILQTVQSIANFVWNKATAITFWEYTFMQPMMPKAFLTVQKELQFSFAEQLQALATMVMNKALRITLWEMINTANPQATLTLSTTVPTSYATKAFVAAMFFMLILIGLPVVMLILARRK